MDTGNDGRILMAIKSANTLKDIFKGKRFKIQFKYAENEKKLDEILRILMTIRYSYMEAKQLAENPDVLKISEYAKEMKNTLEEAMKKSSVKPQTEKDKLVFAEAFYAMETLIELPRKLRDAPSDDAGYAIDLFTVQITEVKKHPEASKLKVCRCTDGKKPWTIITNIETVKKGDIMLAAKLPPVLLMGLLSEAMFVSSEPLPANTEVGKIIKPEGKLLDVIRGHVLNEIKNIK